MHEAPTKIRNKMGAFALSLPFLHAKSFFFIMRIAVMVRLLLKTQDFLYAQNNRYVSKNRKPPALRTPPVI